MLIHGFAAIIHESVGGASIHGSLASPNVHDLAAPTKLSAEPPGSILLLLLTACSEKLLQAGIAASDGAL
jgi:hypothetical protein